MDSKRQQYLGKRLVKSGFKFQYSNRQPGTKKGEGEPSLSLKRGSFSCYQKSIRAAREEMRPSHDRQGCTRWCFNADDQTRARTENPVSFLSGAGLKNYFNRHNFKSF